MDSILGRTILGYKVKEKIGTGGFGNVYRVERNNIVGNVTRALKVISLPKENQYLEVLNSMGGDYKKADDYFKKELDRVVNEIRVFSMISEKDNHYIVSYYENDVEKSGKYKYNIYILMEIMTPLDKWLFENNLTIEEAIDICLDVAKGLKICHKNGIMHRDIKLNNIFVSKDGKFKLGDFGVSKRFDTLTKSHTIKGTPHYIAPEIYVKNEKYDNSSDIYSLGVLMYYLFNKKRYPFYPDYPQTYDKEDEDRAFYKRMQYDKLKYPVCAPKGMAEIVQKAMAKPEERYTDTEQLIEELESVKAQLSRQELETKIGFEPKKEGEQKYSDKDKKIAEDLDRSTINSISFNEHSVDTKWEKKSRKVTYKKFIIAALLLVCIGIMLAIAIGKNMSRTITTNQPEDIRTTINHPENKNDIQTTANQLENEKQNTNNQSETTINMEETIGVDNIVVIKIEDYKGKRYKNIVKKMEDSGLVVKTKKENNNDIKKGYVISQDIAPGTEVIKGATIVLTVSEGKITTTEKKTETQKNKNITKDNSDKDENKGFDFGNIVE